MRISTAGFNQASIDLINQRSAELAAAQTQLSSGKRVQSPADDPAAAVHILQIQQMLSQSQQFAKNADAANARLSNEDQSLSDATDLLQRIRDLTVQANSAGNDATSRANIATELDQDTQQLIDLANRRDANGEYIFAGLASQIQPFARNGVGTVAYAGDQGSRSLQVGQTQHIVDGDSGFQVFQNIPAGNGTFTFNASGANTGTGIVGSASVTNQAAWVADTYTITFTAPDTYQVTDSANNVISSGSFAPGGSIAFNGVNVTIQGQPAAGDTFTAAPAGTQDVFSTLDSLRTTVRSQLNTPAQSAQYASSLGNILTQLDAALGHISDVRATVGARLNAVDTAKSSGQAEQLALQSSLSNLQDLDYASALGKLTLQQTELQAVEASYSRISQLSLFDYLR